MASYPSSIVTLATHNDGDTIPASDINTPNAEIVAMETGLLNGFQHALKPLTDNTYDVGDSTHAFRNIYSKGTVQLGGVIYTFPAADGSANQFLQTNGSKVLAWATPAVGVVDEFRLSLTTAVAVTTADVTAATTLYLVPYVGRRMTIFDASGNASVLTSAEISIPIPATTSQMYDVFVYSNAGVLTLELLAWTNDTTRATAIIKTGANDAAGVYTKSGDVTRRFVGCVRTTTVSGQTEDSLQNRFCVNYYNRVARDFLAQPATGPYTYTTATWRQAEASVTNNQVSCLICAPEIRIHLINTACASGTGDATVQIGIGEDSTTVPLDVGVGGLARFGAATSTTIIPLVYTLDRYPAVGKHTYARMETSAATGTTSWYTNSGATPATHTQGLSGWFEG